MSTDTTDRQPRGISAAQSNGQNQTVAPLQTAVKISAEITPLALLTLCGGLSSSEEHADRPPYLDGRTPLESLLGVRTTPESECIGEDARDRIRFESPAGHDITSWVKERYLAARALGAANHGNGKSALRAEIETQEIQLAGEKGDGCRPSSWLPPAGEEGAGPENEPRSCSENLQRIRAIGRVLSPEELAAADDDGLTRRAWFMDQHREGMHQGQTIAEIERSVTRVLGLPRAS